MSSALFFSTSKIHEKHTVGHMKSTSSSCCSMIMVARASLYAVDLRFLTRTYISFLLSFMVISFHCSSLRRASKIASQRDSALSFLLPHTKPVVTNPISQRLDSLLTVSSGIWSSHLPEDCCLKYDLTED